MPVLAEDSVLHLPWATRFGLQTYLYNRRAKWIPLFLCLCYSAILVACHVVAFEHEHLVVSSPTGPTGGDAGADPASPSPSNSLLQNTRRFAWAPLSFTYNRNPEYAIHLVGVVLVMAVAIRYVRGLHKCVCDFQTRNRELYKGLPPTVFRDIPHAGDSRRLADFIRSHSPKRPARVHGSGSSSVLSSDEDSSDSSGGGAAELGRDVSPGSSSGSSDVSPVSIRRAGLFRRPILIFLVSLAVLAATGWLVEALVPIAPTALAQLAGPCLEPEFFPGVTPTHQTNLNPANPTILNPTNPTNPTILTNPTNPTILNPTIPNPSNLNPSNLDRTTSPLAVQAPTHPSLASVLHNFARKRAEGASVHTTSAAVAVGEGGSGGGGDAVAHPGAGAVYPGGAVDPGVPNLALLNADPLTHFPISTPVKSPRSTQSSAGDNGDRAPSSPVENEGGNLPAGGPSNVASTNENANENSTRRDSAKSTGEESTNEEGGTRTTPLARDLVLEPADPGVGLGSGAWVVTPGQNQTPPNKTPNGDSNPATQRPTMDLNMAVENSENPPSDLVESFDLNEEIREGGETPDPETQNTTQPDASESNASESNPGHLNSAKLKSAELNAMSEQSSSEQSFSEESMSELSTRVERERGEREAALRLLGTWQKHYPLWIPAELLDRASVLPRETRPNPKVLAAHVNARAGGRPSPASDPRAPGDWGSPLMKEGLLAGETPPSSSSSPPGPCKAVGVVEASLQTTVHSLGMVTLVVLGTLCTWLTTVWLLLRTFETRQCGLARRTLTPSYVSVIIKILILALPVSASLRFDTFKSLHPITIAGLKQRAFLGGMLLYIASLGCEIAALAKGVRESYYFTAKHHIGKKSHRL